MGKVLDCLTACLPTCLFLPACCLSAYQLPPFLHSFLPSLTPSLLPSLPLSLFFPPSFPPSVTLPVSPFFFICLWQEVSYSQDWLGAQIFGPGNWTQVLVHPRQALYVLNSSLAHIVWFLKWEKQVHVCLLLRHSTECCYSCAFGDTVRI